MALGGKEPQTQGSIQGSEHSLFHTHTGRRWGTTFRINKEYSIVGIWDTVFLDKKIKVLV
jgi:hypothetical protein